MENIAVEGDKKKEGEEEEMEKGSDESEDVAWKEVVQTAVDAVVFLPNMVEKAFDESCKEGRQSNTYILAFVSDCRESSYTELWVNCLFQRVQKYRHL